MLPKDALMEAADRFSSACAAVSAEILLHQKRNHHHTLPKANSPVDGLSVWRLMEAYTRP
jgi:hypothetical protein